MDEPPKTASQDSTAATTSNGGAPTAEKLPEIPAVEKELFPPEIVEETSVATAAAAQANGDTSTSTATSSSSPDKDGKRRSILLHNLSAGFESISLKNRQSIKKRGSSSLENLSDTEKQQQQRCIYSSALVNFIDPTNTASKTASSMSSKPSPSKFGIRRSHSDSTSFPDLELYQKLTTIFERDYGSTLHSIPYQNVRSGVPEIIDELYIRSILTKAHGVVSDSYVPWGGTAGSTQAVSDPSEWHNGPHCHVYIAACESMDHYRSKVKPALQAFVSQIEGAGKRPLHASTTPPSSGNHPAGSSTHSNRSSNSNDSNDSASASANYSSHYVIVYVPIGKQGGPAPAAHRSSSGSLPAVGNRGISALSARMRRQYQQTRGSSTELFPSDSSDQMNVVTAAETAEDDSTEITTASETSDPAAAPPPGPVTHSSKVEKEIYRKFTTDFPNGKTCIMSTLMLGSSSSADNDDGGTTTTSPLKNQEWNTFLRMLGSAIVNGFRDRCRRYDEELRRLDAHRATPRKKNAKAKHSRFDLSHFFLVKESLAFTYEQMQLPSEALLQYDELAALVLETSSSRFNETVAADVAEEDDYDGPINKNQMSSSKDAQGEQQDPMDLAMAGDTFGFRRRIRTTTDLAPSLPMVMQYLFARETNLLFQMNAPVEVVRRAHYFINTMYQMKLHGVVIQESKLTDEQQRRKRTDAEVWALTTCWDVKCACDKYFSIPIESAARNAPTAITRHENGASEAVSSSEEPPAVKESAYTPIEMETARKLCEMLEFARLRLLRLGDTELACVNPIRSLSQGLPADLKKPWLPWRKHEASLDKNHTSSSVLAPGGMEKDTQWLNGAFASEPAFESKYLQLTAAVVALCCVADRRRCAARFEAERGEIYIRRGEYGLATETLLPRVDVCADDQWDRGHFWRLFRLACCQRITSDAPNYLSTLTRCFGARLSLVAPPKAAEVLQNDLEAVVGDAEISICSLGTAPFLETELSVCATSSGKSISVLNFVRKKIVKNFCAVGEHTCFTLTVTSHLPKAVQVDSIRLSIVTFAKYESIYTNKDAFTEEDVFRILSLESPVKIKPGKNEYKFDWIPLTTGQYILSSVEIRWKAASFHYSCALHRKPMMGIDVLPSDPTQTIELNPLFLIPGHVQPVKIIFHSGSDVITEGTLELICSEGLEVVAPGTEPANDAWSGSCKVLLPPCRPGEKVDLTTSVKSNMGKDSAPQDLGAAQTMLAKVTTCYHHALYDKVKTEEEKSCETRPMKTVLEATVTTLDKPALTVDNVDAFSFMENHVLISVSVICNTPVPFFVKEWDIQLPYPLRVAEDGNLNKELFGQAIAKGEKLSFGFKCVYADEKGGPSAEAEPILHVVLQDESGKTFNQVLALDPRSFYEQITTTEEFAGSNSVVVKLHCSSDEGSVGAPVTLSYRVDASTLTTPKRSSSAESAAVGDLQILYSVDCDGMDWIIGGKVQGILQCSERSSFDLEFVGIPAQPGVLKRFPTISLEYLSSSGDMPAITVHSQCPAVFKSLPSVHHMALAYPAGIEIS